MKNVKNMRKHTSQKTKKKLKSKIFFIFYNMRIVCISDTHSLHNNMRHTLPEGDVLIHAGDISNRGGQKDVTDFVHWFQNIEGFDTKIFRRGCYLGYGY